MTSSCTFFTKDERWTVVNRDLANRRQTSDAEHGKHASKMSMRSCPFLIPCKTFLYFFAQEVNCS